LAGADDARFASAARRMADALPAAVVSLVPGGGHAAHLAQPAVVARLVTHFLGG
jgi:pimeloyl-ACP methyl ester carboxylesterase